MQSVSDFSDLKTHEQFSKQLKKLSDTFLQKNLQDSQEIKNLVGEWIQHFNSLGVMKPVNLSGTFNTLSKLGIFGKKWQKKDQDNFKSLIVKLIKQGNKISTQFNSQDIANTLNALSKWDVLDNQEFKGSKGEFKSLIVKLVDQGNEIDSKTFNSQDIANIYDALYKFDILDDKKWTRDERNKIKSLIVQLAEKGQEQKVLENFNSQEIANIFNAFSKLNILDDKCTGNEQKELKSLIVQLTKRGGSIEGYNLKDIAKICSALLKWSNDADEFKSLTDKLAEQVQAIAEKQNEEDNILDNIRFASQIINDLPKLKSENLITSEGKLLVPLMECLSTSIDKSEASGLKENWPKKNILSGLEGFANIVNELEDKSSLKGEFDQSLIKIFKKLSAVELGSEYKKEEIINKLIRLEVIKDKDALQELLVDQSEDKVLERKEENKPGSGATLPVQPFSGKDGSISGSSQLPKKQEKEEEMKLPILGRGRSNVGQSNKPGTALSGATISNQSPKAKTQSYI